MIDIIRAPGFGVPHGFLGRAGGFSTGELASLNCGTGSGDDAVFVTENRHSAVHAVAPGARLISVYQVHSAECAIVVEPWGDDARPRADALVTDRTGIALSILAADCAPVLFVDAHAGVIGAAHAGWKGALAGVTDATIAAMEALGARRETISAAVGPCIARTSYEVSDRFAAQFLAGDPANERFFTAGRPGHPHFDLEAYVAHRIAAAGVVRVWTSGLDTFANPDRFFSYRRATLGGESGYGRQISIIALA